MSLRRFQDGDLDAIIDFWPRARFIHGGHSEAEERAFFATLREVWVAERDGAVVAFMAVSPGWVDHLYVAPEWQRRGVGSELLGWAMSRMDEIRLHTHQANAPARAFYARHGFAEIEFGISPAPELEPDVLLLWRRATA